MQTNLNNDRSTAGTADLPEQVNRSGRTSSPLLILPQTDPENERGEVLARVYALLIRLEGGKP
jgi:hypothetical protein